MVKRRKTSETDSKSSTSYSSKRSDQEESLYFEHSFAEPCPQVVSNTGQQEAEEWDPHQGVEDAEQLPAFCLWGDVPKTCRNKCKKCQFFRGGGEVNVTLTRWTCRSFLVLNEDYELCCVRTVGCQAYFTRHTTN